ncbi:MAG: leucine-rich repeat domain-containing protein [Chitinophagaceae bacterium]
MRIPLLGLAMICCLFFSCQKEAREIISSSTNDVISQENTRLEAKITKQTTTCWLNGYVFNEQKQPVSGAQVDCGGKTTITDSKGFFYFKEKLTVNKDYALIKVSKTGFLNGFRTFTPNNQKLTYLTEKIVLQAAGTPKIVASTGGTVTIDNIKLTFPANAVVKPGGIAYTGDIRVVARYINPADAAFPYLVPGILSGLNSAGEIKSLQSLGMANVELQDATGAKLEIASGKTVQMELPAPAGSPATIPLWHFNEKFGIWIQQGTANKVNNVYVAEANHFSIWNLDIEFNSFVLTMRFLNVGQVPVSNLRVDVYRANQSFVKGFYTDNAGEASLINCSSNETLTMKVAYPCDTIVYAIAPVTQSRTDVVIINSPAVQSYQFTGSLFTCNNQPLLNQPFQLYLTSPTGFVVLNGITDAQGHINTGTALPNCVGNALNAQTVSYISNRFYYSSTTQVQPGPNNYNATLCDSTGNGGFNDSDIVNIPDPSLRQKVRDVINKQTGNIYYADVKNIKTMRTYSVPLIQTIMGLQYFTSLDTLEITSINGITHSFTDLNPLANLPIRYLDLSRGSLTDISPLQHITTLTDLYLSENHITDISPIQPLHNLKTLWVSVNPIHQVNALQGLTQLTDLGVNTCQLSDISPLQGLTGLQYLNVGFNPQITTISPVQNMTGMLIFNIRGCQVTDISPIQNFASVSTLYLDSNRISNIAPLQNLTQLRYLDLSDNQITNLVSLNNCTLLGTIDLSDNQISSVAPLQGHPGIRSLNLRNNLITDISPLQNNTVLLALALDNNAISNVAPLSGLNLLQQLYLYNNNLTSITPLITSNPNLHSFYITQGNSIPGAQITSFQGTHPSCQVF